MTEQQHHLQKALETQKELIAEVNEINNTLLLKREAIMKYQGIIEYLTGNGVTLPQQETVEKTEEQ